MGISVETLAVAKKYTNRSIEGITGSLAGKNATIDSITDITGGHRVTFKWTADNGDVRTQPMDVMDGAKGDKGETGDAGLGIKAVNINAQSHLIITYDDDTTYDAGELPGGSGEVISVNGKKGVVTLDANDVGALPDDTTIPSKISDLQNDSDFIEKSATAGLVKNDGTIDTKTYIEAVAGKGLSTNDYDDTEKAKVAAAVTKAVNDLTNYYLKTETYTKTEVDNIAAAIKNSRFEVVSTLPTSDIHTNVIYLVPKASAQTNNAKDEYINLNGTSAGWEKIGDTEIDLSGYVTTTALNTALAAYTTTTDLTALLADKVDKVTGKGLSTNDYTDADKELVDSIPTLAPISLVKDTVGWIGKNLLKNIATSQTVNSVTFTVNSDKSVTVNGTGTNPNAGVRELNQHFTLPAGNYILSGSPHNVYSDTGFKLQIYNWTDSIEVVTCNTDEDAHFAIGENKDIAVRIWFRGTPSTSGEDVTFYPMIRRTDIIDDAYEPYHESVETMYEEEIHGINLLKNQGFTRTINGLTYVYNTDGSVTVNGTATANSYVQIKTLEDTNPVSIDGIPVILSGAPAGSAANKYWIYAKYRNADNTTYEKTYEEYGNGIKFTIPNGRKWEIYTAILNGQTVNNLTFYPMIRKADIEDSTYRPYNEQAIQNQLNDKGVLGAKNLLENKGSTATVNGVTFTVNSDGSITVNGTATDTIAYNVNNILLNSLDKNTKYIFSGAPVGSTEGTHFAYIGYQPNNGNFGHEYGKGVEFSLNQTSVQYTSITYFIFIRKDSVLNNAVYKPMIRLASDPDDTYVPYAMTNKELTELAGHTVSYPLEWNSDLNLDTNKGGQLYKYGKMYLISYWFKATTDVSGNTPIIKLPKNGLVNGNYVIAVDNDGAVWGGKAQKDGNDYISISCPIVTGKMYRAQCIFIDPS